MKIEEFIEREQSRADAYRLLAACFYSPQKKVMIEEKLFVGLAGALQQVCPAAAAFPPHMAEALSTVEEQELLVEYARLFVGPFEMVAPPYGSVHLEQGGRIMGDSTMDALKAYREAGLKIDKDFKEVPDHVAVELEFMHYLIHKRNEALHDSRFDEALTVLKRRQDFLKVLLQPWMDSFCGKIEGGTKNGFYLGLARCLRTFVAADRVMEDLPKELEERLSAKV